MPNLPVRQDSGLTLALRELGMRGVDLFTDPAALPPPIAARMENVDGSAGVLSRRDGAIKVAQPVTPATVGASRTFGADTKYATFIPPAIPLGGWAIYRHFTLVWPGSGLTAYLISSRPNGQTYHVVKLTSSDAGVLTFSWRDNGGTTRTVTSSAIADGTDVHLFAIYDAVAGTFTVYVNGASVGTPLTGLSATLKPATDTVTWALGLEKETGAAVTTNTFHSGKDDGLTLFTLRGQRPASGTTRLAETLRRHSARAWPNPAMDMVLAQYDLDEASGTVMYDRSWNKNHGTYVGSPSVTAPVALLSAPGNHVGFLEVPYGKANLFATYGAMFYETLGAAVT